MKRLSAAMTVIVCFILLLSTSVGLAMLLPIREYFGAQGGELVQLASSHVPTESDMIEYKEYQRGLKRELRDMTGSD